VPAGIEVADVGQQFGGDLAARLGHRPRWADLAQQPGGLACGDLICHAAGNQLTQQRMQPADGLVAGPGKITMPLGPHLQHTGLAICDHFLPGRRPQRQSGGLYKAATRTQAQVRCRSPVVTDAGVRA
jgi:hypothetical protein